MSTLIRQMQAHKKNRAVDRTSLTEALHLERAPAGITPGDYATVTRRNRFSPIDSPRAAVDALEDECRLKEGGITVQPVRLRTRILRWAEEETRFGRLPSKTGNVLEAVFYRGDLHRCEVAGILGTTPRHARRVTAALIEEGALASDRPRAPLRIAFPATLALR
jgi:hypothetical protein